jgi:hypothetical protein
MGAAAIPGNAPSAASGIRRRPRSTRPRSTPSCGQRAGVSRRKHRRRHALPGENADRVPIPHLASGSNNRISRSSGDSISRATLAIRSRASSIRARCCGSIAAVAGRHPERPVRQSLVLIPGRTCPNVGPSENPIGREGRARAQTAPRRGAAGTGRSPAKRRCDADSRSRQPEVARVPARCHPASGVVQGRSPRRDVRCLPVQHCSDQPTHPGRSGRRDRWATVGSENPSLPRHCRNRASSM